MGLGLSTLGAEIRWGLFCREWGGWRGVLKLWWLKDTMLPRACALRWFGRTWRRQGVSCSFAGDFAWGLLDKHVPSNVHAKCH